MRCTVMNVNNTMFACTQHVVSSQCTVSDKCLDILDNKIIGEHMDCCYSSASNTMEMTCKYKAEARIYYPHWYYSGVYTYTISDHVSEMKDMAEDHGHVQCNYSNMNGATGINMALFIAMLGLASVLFAMITGFTGLACRVRSKNLSYNTIPEKHVHIDL